ncbi:phage tail tape measure protein [Aeribacillus composti]|uniref:phage tail tape measure protein n=1 Tax=Aeribacillus composti TaxID=1868734 RepID=UPI002E21AD4F|nr:phage tail tape measure protein [Aeribacillus composti]
MAKDVRIRLYSNSTQFKSEMSSVARQMKLVKSEFEAARTSIKNWGNELKQAEARSQFLNRQIDLQKQKVSLLEKAYKDSVAKKGEDAKETQNLARRLNYATAELNKLQNQIKQTNEYIDQFKQKQESIRFNKEMNALSLQMQKIQSQYRLAASEAGVFGDELKQTQLYADQLTKKIEVQQKVIKRLEEEYRRIIRVTGAQSEETQKLIIEKNKAVAALNGFQNELAQTTSKIDKLQKEMNKQNSAFAGFTNNMNKIGSRMQSIGTSVGVTATAGVTAVTFAMRDAVKVGMEFGYQVSRVGAISEASAEQVQQLKDQALELGASTTKSASQVAQGQEQLAASGFKVNEILSAMPGVIAAVEASGEDMATVSEIMAAAIRGFGLEASKSAHIADVFAMAANRSNASILDMGYSFKYAAPIAKQLGISVEELAAATGIMRDRGMAAEQIGTSLRMGLTRLISPTKDAATVMDKLGINIKDAKGNMLPLPEVISRLQRATKNLTQEQKLNAFQTIFGTEAMTGFLNLVDAGPKALSDLSRALRESDGASQKAASAMKDNLAGAVEEMNGALETAKIRLTDALTPALKGAAGFITDLTNKWNSLNSDTQEVIASTGALAFAITGVVGAVGTLTAAIGALMTFAGPVGLAIVGTTAALGGLGLGLYAAHEATEKLKRKQEEHEKIARRYGENLSAGTLKGVKGYTDLYEGAKLKLTALQTMSGEKAKATSQEVVNAFSKMADQVISALETQRDRLTNAINEVYGIAGDAGKKKAQEMTNQIIENFDKDIANYKKALDTIKVAHDKYQNDLSKMPAEFAAKYQEALSIMQKGSLEFARSQNELIAIQKSIASNQGKILTEEAQGYLTTINDAYKKSVESANQWYAEKQKTFEKALTQGKISQEQYNNLMVGVETRTNEMLARAAQERDAALSSLAKNLDTRGQLIDIATGKIFERQKKFFTDMNGFTVQIEESDREYIERWKAHTEEVLKSSADFSEKTKKLYQQHLQTFLESTGMTKEEAKKIATQMVNETLAEMEKGKDRAGKAGKDKGQAHKQGLDSTKAGNKQAAAGVKSATDEGLAQGKDSARKHGQEKGSKHQQGILSTYMSNKSAASTISGMVSGTLGRTTDGGGGRRAGTQFVGGLRSQQGGAYSAGKSVASKGESGLRSVRTRSAGTAFWQGFEIGIRSGGGPIGRAAWSLGKMALSALKRAIDSHSPSKETEKEGKNYAAGFSVGIKKNTKKTVASATAMANAVKKAFNEAMSKAQYKYKMGITSTSGYIKELKYIRSHYAKTADQVRKVNLEIKRIQDLTAKRTAAQIAAEKKARESLNKSVKSASDAYLKKVKSINDKLAQDIKKANENYNKQLAERTKEIYQSFGLFDDVKIEQVSKQSLFSNLQNQLQVMNLFYDNIKKLSKRAPKDFVNELRELGIGYADEIQAIASMSATELNNYVNLWRQKHKIAAQQAAIELEPLKKATQAQIKSLTAAANKELDQAKKDFINKLLSLSSTVAKLGSLRNSGKALGRDTVRGLIEGLRNMDGPLRKQARALAKTIENEIKRTLRIHSPSGVMRDEVAPWIPAGIAEGIKRNIGYIQKAIDYVVKTTKEKFHADMGKVSLNISSAAQAIKANKQELLLKHQIDSPSLQNELMILREGFNQLAELFKMMLQVQTNQLEAINNQSLVVQIGEYEVAKAIRKPVNDLNTLHDNRLKRFRGR